MKEVFVFGAGASHALANLPLGNELVWNYHMDCTLCRPIINGTPDNTQDNIQFAELRKFLVLASKIYPELEKYINNYDKRGLFMFTPIVDSKRYFVDEMLKIFREKGNHEGVLLTKKLILKHLDGASLGKHNAYKDFFEKVLLKKNANYVSIISFNFDYLLNDYYENGIDDGLYFDYLLDFDCVLKDGYKHRAPIQLIKLNGSLDWGLCNKCNKLRLYFPHMLDRYYFGNGWPPVCHIGKCDGIIEPYIFIPHQKYDERISSLWNKAKEILKGTDKIKIIGYSFPEYDQPVIDLFKENLNCNVELKIIDKCERDNINRIKEKYKAIFPNLNGEIKIIHDGFKEYLENYNS